MKYLFFIEFVNELRSLYNLLNKKTLASILLSDEILRVNIKVYRLFEKEKNLTLCK